MSVLCECVYYHHHQQTTSRRQAALHLRSTGRQLKWIMQQQQLLNLNYLLFNFSSFLLFPLILADAFQRTRDRRCCALLFNLIKLKKPLPMMMMVVVVVLALFLPLPSTSVHCPDHYMVRADTMLNASLQTVITHSSTRAN